MAAPKTVKTYPLAGTNRDFEIPFEYLARKFVIVTLIGTDRKELVLNVDYRFTQRTIITLTRVWGPEEGYNLIEIKRVTSATERLVDFSDGSILRASDLNTATVQALHIAEEGRDIATDTIGVDNNGQLDARGRQIKNLADGVEDGDAISMRQIRAYDTSALNSANRSEQSRLASEAARDGSVQARTGAETARTGSEAARDLSQRWAANPENAAVAGGLYSALHYAAKSAYSQDISFQAMVRSELARDRSESARDRSETAATTATSQANRATTEADRAKSEADKLGNMNALGAAIESVVGNDVTWKGIQIWKAARVDVYSPTGNAAITLRNSNGQAWMKMEYGASNNTWVLADYNGRTYLTTFNNGRVHAGAELTAQGQMYTYGGGVQINAINPTANSHVWLNSNTGAERALIYGDSGSTMHLRAGGSASELLLGPDGALRTTAGARFLQDGNITSTIYGPLGGVHGVLSAMGNGRSRRTEIAELVPASVAFGNGNVLTLAADARDFELLMGTYTPDRSIWTTLDVRWLANLPVRTKMYVPASPNGYILCQFEDTNPDERKVLRFVAFGANSGWSGLWGVRESPIL